MEAFHKKLLTFLPVSLELKKSEINPVSIKLLFFQPLSPKIVNSAFLTDNNLELISKHWR